MKFSVVFLAAFALTGVVNVEAGPIDASNDLQEVFNEFQALVPQDQIVALFVEYLAVDPEVQAVVAYARSDSFKELSKKIESIQDVQNLYAFLADCGLDIYGFVNGFNEFIGIPPYKPNKSGMRAQLSGGMAGLIKDIKALIPYDKIKALYHEKLTTSPAFARLVAELRSPKYQKLVDALRANQEFRKIVEFSKKAGIDINAIKNLLASMFGLEFPSSYLLDGSRITPRNALENDLQEFINLLPTKQIRNIAVKHFMFDKEFRHAVEYVRTEEFHKLVKTLNDIPEYTEILNALESLGLDVKSTIEKIDEAIRYPGNRSPSASPHSIVSFVDEVKAVLPLKEINDLYKKKLETSEDFKNLVGVLSSKQFQAMTNALFADPGFQAFLHKVQAHGIDLKVVADFFLKFFGITTPPGIID